MREQIAHVYPPVIPKRASLPSQQPQYVQTRNRTADRTTSDDVYGEEDYQQPTRMPTSARRYQQLPRTPQQQLPPPEPERKRLSWLVWVGIVLCVMLIGWTGLNALGSFIHEKQDDFIYGFPRTYQTDQNVGHYGRVSHFICLNLHGEIEVIETQPGHPEASKIYTVLVLPKDQDRVPVTISFEDINGDGKVDALVHIGATEIPLYNNGVTFQSQPPAPAK
jgi:hypothetical protein